MRVSLLAVVLIAACGHNQIEVSGTTPEPSRDALFTAIDAFVEAGRTPVAYGELARAVAALRPGASRAVAGEAELRLIVLALGPVRAMQGRPVADQIDLLALTVWPTLLAPPIDVDSQHELAPKAGEDPGRYLRRLCGGPLAASCEHAVPELQGPIVYALALHRASTRARDAIDRCLSCSSDPDWHAAALAWEELDRGAEQHLMEVARRAHGNAGVRIAAGRARPGI